VVGVVKTLAEIFERLPEGWMVMSLAGPHHSDGRYYCCLRSKDMDGRFTAVSYADDPDTAFCDAVGKAKAMNLDIAP
jgi:hypothetical protein